eukprot:gnl/TRDRNA2_/TRDRNA2_94271_c0_seq1.p1 gnl/TRDRNA2_/TRDRNA2_94271_c0~~gnl/TRDRNA2_/TRDRNA2_94271_c0_seq1.p1  ORF type:complete len:103 (+),score=18.03 gnl/TRDRNA2_/TRDRNA2_94271_c0_seq1:49-357(+)
MQLLERAIAWSIRQKQEKYMLCEEAHKCHTTVVVGGVKGTESKRGEMVRLLSDASTFDSLAMMPLNTIGSCPAPTCIENDMIADAKTVWPDERARRNATTPG